MADEPTVNSRCPRCGGGFHCGMRDATPCACAALPLDAASLQGLHDLYAGCLCLRCSSEIEAGANPSAVVRRAD